MSFERATAAARSASSKSPDSTIMLDVGELIGITDYFVITSGRNDRQVRAIVDEVVAALRKEGGGPLLRREGHEDASWVLLDYGDVVVHVFDAEARDFYGLERLWADAKKVEWDTPAVSGPAGRL